MQAGPEYVLRHTWERRDAYWKGGCSEYNRVRSPATVHRSSARIARSTRRLAGVLMLRDLWGMRTGHIQMKLLVPLLIIFAHLLQYFEYFE